MNKILTFINKKFTFSSQINYDLLKIVCYYITKISGSRTPLILTPQNFFISPFKSRTATLFRVAVLLLLFILCQDTFSFPSC